jgi:chitodextrinase
MKRRLITLAATGLLAAAAATAGVIAALPAAAAPTICDKFGSTTVSNGRYVVMNNVWGDDTTQCIDVNQTGPGFTVTTASHNKATNGAPGAYPAIYFGCHYANCSTGSGLPMAVSNAAFNNITTSVNMTYPGSGIWDAAYDIWFDPTPRTDGQNTGAELMVWLNWTSPIQPVGSQVATVNLLGATWQVWEGNVGWNVVSYRRVPSTTSMSFNVRTFYDDMVSRGFASRSWFLTSIQAGFEPWVGQTGLAVNSFSVSTSGGGDTQAPSAPSNLTASGTTSTSTNLSWNASTDNVGVTGYNILRATGTSGGTFSQVGTSTSTSFSNSGLTANTSYRYQVQAFDAAGNVSAASNTVTITTSGGGGDTTPPSAPSNLTASGTTSTSTNLSWNASTDNVGVTGYNILRATGTSGGTFSQVGTSTSTSFTNSGLTANTSYRFQVQARDAAGNVSAVSNTVTVTTSGGGGGGACSAGYRIVNAWNGGFQAEVTVTAGTAAINGWTVGLTFPSGVTITQMWNATFTASGNTVTAKNVSYNGSLGANASTTFGFTANFAGSSGATATTTCTSP